MPKGGYLDYFIGFRFESMRVLTAAALLLSFSLVRSAVADSTSSVSAHYPSGAIHSVETADEALMESGRERSQIEARFATEEHACASRFFATSCIDQAKERRRQALMQLRAVEIEAHTFKRQERVIERDQVLSSKQAQDSSDMRQSEATKSRKPTENSQPDNMSEPARHVQATIFPDRSARHEAKLKEIKAEEVTSAKKRAENIAAYERKVAEAKEHQKRVEEKKAEKERKRKSKMPTSGQQ